MKYLVLLFLLISCAHHKYKVGDCFIENNSEAVRVIEGVTYWDYWYMVHMFNMSTRESQPIKEFEKEDMRRCNEIN